VSAQVAEERKRANARAKLDMDRAGIENAAADLVSALNRLDRAIKHVIPARDVMLQLTNAQLQCAVLLQQLCLAEVTLWNEL